MKDLLSVYRSIGDMDFGKLKKDGLLKLEVDEDGKPIPITTYDPKDDTSIYIG